MATQTTQPDGTGFGALYTKLADGSYQVLFDATGAYAGNKDTAVSIATVGTTGTTSVYTIVPETSSLASINFSCVDALAAHDTNYVTFAITNLGQAGSGSTALLAATAANTSKVTGGTAIVANGKRSLTVHGTAANLAVVAGDRLKIDVVASGTLANTLTYGAFLLRFSGVA